MVRFLCVFCSVPFRFPHSFLSEDEISPLEKMILSEAHWRTLLMSCSFAMGEIFKLTLKSWANDATELCFMFASMLER